MASQWRTANQSGFVNKSNQSGTTKNSDDGNNIKKKTTIQTKNAET